MSDFNFTSDTLQFDDLEIKYGHDNATAIVRMLEQFEGVLEARVAKLSFEERMENVCCLMKENIRYQTRH